MPGAPAAQPLGHCLSLGLDRHLPVAARVLQELLDQLHRAGAVTCCCQAPHLQAQRAL